MRIALQDYYGEMFIRADELPTTFGGDGGWAQFTMTGDLHAHAQTTTEAALAEVRLAVHKLVPRIAKHQRARDRLPADPLYIRYGRTPKGTSRNHATGAAELGVSVYEAAFDPVSGLWNVAGEGDAGTLIHFTLGGVPASLVSGTRLASRGSDGEPLLEPGTVVKVASLAYTGEGFRARLGR